MKGNKDLFLLLILDQMKEEEKIEKWILTMKNQSIQDTMKGLLWCGFLYSQTKRFSLIILISAQLLN